MNWKKKAILLSPLRYYAKDGIVWLLKSELKHFVDVKNK